MMELKLIKMMKALQLLKHCDICLTITQEHMHIHDRNHC